MNSSISNKRRIFEILAVIITGVGKFIFMDWLNVRLAFMTVACVFWILYVFVRLRKDKSILKYWGLTKLNFNKTFIEILPFAIITVVLFVVVGRWINTSVLSINILPILLLYPIWGIIQQFIMIGIFARNLKDMNGVAYPIWIIIMATAISFAIVHYPYGLLIIGTFLLALVYTHLYLKGRNLIVMGIYHGWVGAFFFYTLLSRDSWEKVFLAVFN